MSIESIKNEILEKVEKAVKKVLNKKPKELKLVFPPNIRFGDFALECFSLAKQFKKSPEEIAELLAEEIRPSLKIRKLEAVGPYLNFKLANKFLFSKVCLEIATADMNFGNSAIGKNQRVMIEYLSPNANKPLHLGHIRNGVLGMAIANVFEANGYSVIRANLINDRGVHICKSMLAWQKWGNNQTPKTSGIKGDHFVGDLYSRYAIEVEKNPEFENEIQEMLQKWETGDKKTIKLWKMMNKWVYKGFKKTYQKLGLKFDTYYYESDTYKLGKEIVKEGLKNNIFFKNENNIILFNLPEIEFGKEQDGSLKKVTLLRSDGTSLYITQDIGTALLKATQYNISRSIYVVGSEQEYYFKCLFTILKKLGYSWVKGCYHLSYGMVYLPEGKMKSREGKIVNADDLIEEMEIRAKEEIEKHNPENKLSEEKINSRASKIGIGAIKFYLLRIHPSQDIHFLPKESISFDGFTGPYCQYAYSRTAGILHNAQSIKWGAWKNIDFSVLGNEEELLLIQKLLQFPEKVKAVILESNPSQLAVHLYETSKVFNQFYKCHSVLRAKNVELVKARLALVKATAIVLKKGLSLLGIETMEKM